MSNEKMQASLMLYRDRNLIGVFNMLRRGKPCSKEVAIVRFSRAQFSDAIKGVDKETGCLKTRRLAA